MHDLPDAQGIQTGETIVKHADKKMKEAEAETARRRVRHLTKLPKPITVCEAVRRIKAREKFEKMYKEGSISIDDIPEF